MRLIFNQVNTYNVKCLSKKLQKFNLYNLNHIKRCVNVIVDQVMFKLKIIINCYYYYFFFLGCG